MLLLSSSCTKQSSFRNTTAGQHDAQCLCRSSAQLIMDLCSYTRLGLTGYLTSRGIKKQEIVEVNCAEDLHSETPPPGNMTHSACADPQRS
jgi:hypothetical protein